MSGVQKIPVSIKPGADRGFLLLQFLKLWPGPGLSAEARMLLVA